MRQDVCGWTREGSTSLMSRLSFRAKLLLVLFVPFLALVVVAAAGLSDRFTALHAQEQYGDLAAPLRSLDAASRALQNESVVSSWYVAGTTAPPTTELTEAVPDRRRGARVPRQRAGLRRRRHGPGRRCRARRPRTRVSTASRRRGARIDARAVDVATTRNFSSASTTTARLRRGRRPRPRDCRVSASVTRVFALEQEQNELAREATCTSRCSPVRRERLPRVDRRGRPQQARYRDLSPTPPPTRELQAFRA